MTNENRREGNLPVVGAIIVCLALVATTCYAVFGPLQVGTVLALGLEERPAVSSDSVPGKPGTTPASEGSTDARITKVEEMLRGIMGTVGDSEKRSYENKMMARELIGYIKIMVLVLILIAVGFPLTIWLLSRRRILGLSGLSSEVNAALVVIEQRQNKLANILKDVQGEIDYIHTMSVPDLKNLIQQAENYLKQNEKDLEKAGVSRDKPAPRQ
jgi:hypothetical protein